MRRIYFFTPLTKFYFFTFLLFYLYKYPYPNNALSASSTLRTGTNSMPNFFRASP